MPLPLSLSLSLSLFTSPSSCPSGSCFQLSFSCILGKLHREPTASLVTRSSVPALPAMQPPHMAYLPQPERYVRIDEGRGGSIGHGLSVSYCACWVRANAACSSRCELKPCVQRARARAEHACSARACVTRFARAETCVLAACRVHVGACRRRVLSTLRNNSVPARR